MITNPKQIVQTKDRKLSGSDNRDYLIDVENKDQAIRQNTEEFYDFVNVL